MRKNILLILLCTPLAWTAWRDLVGLYAKSNRSDSPLEMRPQQTGPKPEKLARIVQSADAVLALPEALVATVWRLEPAPEGLVVSGPLAQALWEHARARGGRRPQ